MVSLRPIVEPFLAVREFSKAHTYLHCHGPSLCITSLHHTISYNDNRRARNACVLRLHEDSPRSDERAGRVQQPRSPVSRPDAVM